MSSLETGCAGFDILCAQGASFTIEVVARCKEAQRKLAVIGKQLTRGETLKGGRLADYRITAPIGSGQASETYKAVVAKLYKPTNRLKVGQQVVVKVPKLEPEITETDAQKRLDDLDHLIRSEEMSLLRLDGLACVAQHLDSGSFYVKLSTRKEVRSTFIVERYIKGKNLDAYMRRKHHNFKGIPTAKEFFFWAEKLGTSLRQIHREVVVHGDIWPENILVNISGKPVFIDFGQALLRERRSAAAEVSGRNEKYVAPEKVKSVEGDVYSLGGVLFNLATGEDPPKGIKDIEKLKEHVINSMQARNPRLYRDNCGIADVIARCLRWSRHGRTPNAELVLQDIEVFRSPPRKPNATKDTKTLQRAASSLDHRGHPLFRWMASLRSRALRSVFDEMAKGIYDLTGDHEDLVGTLTQYLRLLGSGDEYLTVSVPRFWHPENLGINGRFLSMNRLIAQGGASVRRVFLITDKEKTKDKFLGEIVAAQLRFQKQAGSEKCYLGYRPVKDDERAIMIREGKHFGLLIKDRIPVAMFPVYRDDGLLVTIRFRAGQNFVGNLRGTYFEQERQATPLAKYSRLRRPF